MNSGTCPAATVGYISAKQEKYDTAAKDVITKNTLQICYMIYMYLYMLYEWFVSKMTTPLQETTPISAAFKKYILGVSISSSSHIHLFTVVWSKQKSIKLNRWNEMVEQPQVFTVATGSMGPMGFSVGWQRLSNPRFLADSFPWSAGIQPWDPNKNTSADPTDSLVRNDWCFRNPIPNHRLDGAKTSGWEMAFQLPTSTG